METKPLMSDTLEPINLSESEYQFLSDPTWDAMPGYMVS